MNRLSSQSSTTGSAQATIASLGEILWDLLPSGRRCGGAPANVAYQAAALGGVVYLVSRVGDDALGREALQTLRRPGLSTRFVGQSARLPTGRVSVTLDAEGTASYEFGRDEAWDHLPWSSEFTELAARLDAVCFGTLGQRGSTAQRTIRRFLDATAETTLRVLDVNLRPPYYSEAILRASLQRANVLKLNEGELVELSGLCELPDTPSEALQKLLEVFQLRCVALTRGAAGALLVTTDEMSDWQHEPVAVCDTVGAGDIYTAALVVGLLRGDRLATINRQACRLAAYVCTQPGGTPALPQELTDDWTQPIERVDLE